MKLLILLIPFSLLANDACRNLVSLAQDSRGQLVNFYKEDPSLFENKELISTENDKGSYTHVFQGSILKSDNSVFSRCQKNSSRSWGKVQGKNSQEHWKLSWAVKLEKVITTIQDSYNSCMSSGNTQELEASIKDAKEILTNHFKFIRKCEAVKHLTSFSDYDDVEVNTEKKKINSTGTITCKKTGAITQDWDGCVRVIDTFDASTLAIQAATTIHKMHVAFDNKDVSEDNYKSAINAQIKALEAQKDHSILLSTTYAAQAAALGAAIASTPKIDSIISHCEDEFKGAPSEEEFLKTMKTIVPDYAIDFQVGFAEQSKQAVCANTVRHGDLSLIENDMAKESAKQAAIQMTLKAGEQIAVSFLVGKNIKKLEAMLNSVEKFKPNDLNYSLADLVAEECQVNPGSENCRSAQAYLESKGFQGSSITIGSSGNSYSSGTQLPEQDVTFNAKEESTSGPGTNKIAPIGGTKYTNNSFDAPGRASVKSNKASLGGGSGAGSPGRMAGATGSSSNRNGAAQKSRYKPSSYAYKGKTSSGYRGGSGKSSKKKRGGLLNKFKNLFKSKSTVTNFKADSSIEKAQGRHLFQIISSRYHMVEKSKRLMEYTKE